MQLLTRDIQIKLRIAVAVLAILAVAIAIVVTDLSMGGANEPTPENQAALGPGVAAATPLPDTPVPIPSASAPTAGPTTVSGPIAQMRDERRKSDLEAVRAALEKYYDKKKEYPSTGGNAQTMCTYPDLDALCKLTDFLDPVPADPRGDSATNGYWYISDGKSFTLIAEMEIKANVSPQGCPQVPVKTKTDLYCVRGSH